MTPRGTRQVGSHRVSEHVASEILRLIDEQRLEPGTRLGTEDELAREFGVSRPTLREALRILSGGDLVRATKGARGGVFVANTVEKGMGQSISGFIAMLLETRRVTIEDLLEVRGLIEAPLAGLAAQAIDDEGLAELRAAVELYREAADGDMDKLELASLDARIHHAIAAAAGNPVVEAFMDWVFDVLHPSMKTLIEPAVVESLVADQHEAILAAIESRDPERAENAMREHLAYLSELVSAVRAGQGDGAGRSRRRDGASRSP